MEHVKKNVEQWRKEKVVPKFPSLEELLVRKHTPIVIVNPLPAPVLKVEKR